MAHSATGANTAGRAGFGEGHIAQQGRAGWISRLVPQALWGPVPLVSTGVPVT